MPAILRRPEFLIFAAALLTRLVANAVLGPANYDFGDAFAYRNVAQNIAAGRGFQITLGEGPGPRLEAARKYEQEWHLVAMKGRPTMFYEPVLPLFLAGLYRIFGSGGDRIFVVIQILLGSWMCALVYHLGGRLASPKGAILAGFLAAGYPLLIFYSIVLMTEMLFYFFLVAAFLQGLRYFEKPTLSNAALLGLWIALGVLTRSTMIVAVPFVIVGLLLMKRSARQKLTQALALAAVLVLFIGAWAARNYVTFGHAVIMPTKGAWNFFNTMGSSMNLIGAKTADQRRHWDDPGFWTLEHLQELYPDLKKADLTFPPDPLPETEYERAQQITARTWEFLLSNPGFAARGYLGVVGRMYLPFMMETPSRALRWLMGLAYIAVLALGISGWWRCRKRGSIQVMMLALLAYALLVPLYSYFSANRGRLTFDVILICLSACSLGYLAQKLSRVRRPAAGDRLG